MCEDKCKCNPLNPFLAAQQPEPDHYYGGGDVECIEAIRAALGAEQFIGHCRACVIKYVWRYPHKGKVADLKKAADYLDWLIDAEQHRGDDD